MWKQISLSDALRAFLSGQAVKVVDFTEDTVLSLQDVLQRFEAGAVMFAEVSPAAPEPEPAAPEPEDEYDRKDPMASAALFSIGDGMSHQKGSEPAAASEKRPAGKISDTGKLRALRAAGWTVKAIAEEFGCSEQTVRNAMKKEGIS